MFKWDAISWWATGIFALSLALGGLVHGAWLFLMVGAYLLRPTLNALGVAKRYADERQLQIQFHSGNIGFAVAMLAAAALGIKAQLEGRRIEEYVFIMSFGLAAKAIVGLMMAADPRTVGVRIACTIGLLATLFTLLEGGTFVGIVIQGLPGVIVMSIGLLGLKKPLASGVLLALVAGFTAYFFGSRGVWGMRVQGELLVTVPLAVAAISMFRATRTAPLAAGTLAPNGPAG